MPFKFGADIKYKFYPIKDEISSDDAFDITQFANPVIFVFNEKPSRADAQAGTGNIQSITSWTNTEDGRGKQFTISAIDDPDISSENKNYSYWLAINFELQASEQTQTVMRMLPIKRLTAHHSTAMPTVEDLEAIHPNITEYFLDHVIDAALVSALQITKLRLKANGWDYASIWNPDELRLAVGYKALAELSLSQIAGGGSWSDKYKEYKATYETLLKEIEFLIDKDKDGEPDKKESLTNVVSLIR
jgi:hypothetical protein